MGTLITTSAGVHAAATAGAGGMDADALAFITAITNAGGTLLSSEEDAIDFLVKGFKANGTWSKKIAIYPIVGSTALEQKWNLKDPRDLDAAFRLIFAGSWLHTRGVMKGDGSTTYANTFVTDTIMGASAQIVIYSRKDIAENSMDAGSNDNDPASSNRDVSTQFIFRWSDNNDYTRFVGLGDGVVSTAMSTSFCTVHATLSSGAVSVYKDGVLLNSQSVTVRNFTGKHQYLGAWSFSDPASANPFGFPTSRPYSYAEWSHAHTATEIAADMVTLTQFYTMLDKNFVYPLAFLQQTLDIIAALLAIGIVLTENQTIELDEFLRSQPAPVAASKKKKTKGTVSISPEVKEFLRSLGIEI